MTGAATVAEDGFGDPPRAADGPPVLSAGGFEAPIDWLLDMARTRRIDLARLPVGPLIGSFAEALETALDGPEPVRLERWGDWLVMAATLTLLWSRLVPASDATDDDPLIDPDQLLRDRLADRVFIGEAASWLERRPQLGRDVFRRGGVRQATPGRSADITDLLWACLVQLRVTGEETTRHVLRLPAFWRVHDALGRMERLLGEASDPTPLLALLPPISDGSEQELRRRAAVASTVLAALEMSKRGTVTLQQARPWDLIQVAVTGELSRCRADDVQCGVSADHSTI